MYELKEELNIENMIYEIRGKQVMFNSDVARLYNVETKRINEVIKRNINRFPEEFCFQITIEELEMLSSRSQIATLNKSNNYRGYNIKYLPYVLTEQGIMMLSGLLKSDIAVKVNVQIIDAFVKMRKYISNNLYQNEKILINHENRLLMLEESFDKLNEKEKINHIFYEGQIYDAYSLLIDILSKSKEEVIIIDNYAGKELLDIIKDIKQNIKIVSSNIDSTLKKKYESQYSNVTFMNNNTFHDRFVIIDRKELYNSGASFKDLGNKCFALNKIEDKKILNNIIRKIG
jgi:toxin-antitoxin system, toxin component, fic family